MPCVFTALCNCAHNKYAGSLMFLLQCCSPFRFLCICLFLVFLMPSFSLFVHVKLFSLLLSASVFVCEAECMCLELPSKVDAGYVLHLSVYAWESLWMTRWVSFITSVRELGLLPGMCLASVVNDARLKRSVQSRLVSQVSLDLLASEIGVQ